MFDTFVKDRDAIRMNYTKMGIALYKKNHVI